MIKLKIENVKIYMIIIQYIDENQKIKMLDLNKNI